MCVWKARRRKSEVTMDERSPLLLILLSEKKEDRGNRFLLQFQKSLSAPSIEEMIREGEVLRREWGAKWQLRFAHPAHPFFQTT